MKRSEKMQPLWSLPNRWLTLPLCLREDQDWARFQWFQWFQWGGCQVLLEVATERLWWDVEKLKLEEKSRKVGWMWSNSKSGNYFGTIYIMIIMIIRNCSARTALICLSATFPGCATAPRPRRRPLLGAKRRASWERSAAPSCFSRGNSYPLPRQSNKRYKK